jgi:peptidoglycan hydrolase CwlO-like protein
MSKLNTEGTFLEKPSSIWLTIGTVIISFAVALATLQSGREVNAGDIQELRVSYTTINQKLDLLNSKLNESSIKQAEIQKDIDYIKKEITR